MKNITVNEISNILDKAYSEYINNGKKINIIFFGEEGYGRNVTIENWLENHPNINDNLPIARLFKNKNGDNIGYGFIDEEIISANVENNIWYIKRFNKKPIGEINAYINLIKNRHYETYNGNKYNLNNVFLVILSCYYSNTSHKTEMSEDDLKLFECYNVIPSWNEFIQYELNYFNTIIKECDNELANNEIKNDIEILNNLKNNSLTSIKILKIIEPLNLNFSAWFPPVKLDILLNSQCKSINEFIEKLDLNYSKDFMILYKIPKEERINIDKIIDALK